MPMGVKWCRLTGLTIFSRRVTTKFGGLRTTLKAPVFSPMVITDRYGTRRVSKIRKFAPLAFLVNGCGSTPKTVGDCENGFA